MKHHSLPDLHEVRAGFETWRRTRQGKERIPPPLQEAVRLLLEHFPATVVRRELHLSSQQLERLRHSKAAQPQTQAPAFLALTALDLPALSPAVHAGQPAAAPTTRPSADCLAVLERQDGVKLSLSLPLEGLERVITSFVRA